MKYIRLNDYLLPIGDIQSAQIKTHLFGDGGRLVIYFGKDSESRKNFGQHLDIYYSYWSELNSDVGVLHSLLNQRCHNVEKST